MVINALKKFDDKKGCPECTFRDCPKASSTDALCDVHSITFSPARIRKLMKDAPKYLSLVLHTREEVEQKKFSAIEKRATEKQVAAVVSNARDSHLQETLARLEELNVENDFGYKD